MRIIRSLCTILFLLALSACDEENVPQPGFAVITQESDIILGTRYTAPVGGIIAIGSWLTDVGSASGNVKYFATRSTFPDGFISVPNGRAPATWNFSESNGRCAGQMVAPNVQVSPGQEVVLVCYQVDAPAFSASPNNYDVNGIKAVKISGPGIRNTYGAPLLSIVNRGGTAAYYQGAPDSSAPDMSWVMLSADTLTTVDLSAGSYGIVVQNALGDGSYGLVGVAPFTVNNNYPNCGKGGLCPP